MLITKDSHMHTSVPNLFTSLQTHTPNCLCDIFTCSSDTTFQTRTFNIPPEFAWPVLSTCINGNIFCPVAQVKNPKRQLWLASFLQSLIHNTEQGPPALFPNRLKSTYFSPSPVVSTVAAMLSPGHSKWLSNGLPSPMRHPWQFSTQ